MGHSVSQSEAGNISQSESWPRMLREADLDLVNRLLQGFFPYPILLIVLAVTTNFRQDHAGVFWVASASVGITTGLRVFIKIYGERLGSRRQLRFLIAATVVLSSVTSGYVYSATLWFYGFENWTFIVMMLCLVGFASGGTISFTPGKRTGARR